MSFFTENTGEKPVATLHDGWLRSLETHPEKDAVRDSHGTVYTYAEVELLASRIARYLCDCGVEARDVVSCQLPGWAEFLPIYIACLKIGAVVKPIPPNLRFHELKQMLRRCGSKVLFLPRSYRKFTYCGMAGELRRAVPHVRAIIAVDKFGEGSSLPSFRQIVEEDIAAPLMDEESRAARAAVGADDLAAIVFTSGSEGEAKGVMLSHRNILAAESMFAAFFSLGEHDVMFMPAPVAHAIGFHHGVTLPFLAGATTVLQDRFAGAESLELMERHKATVTMASSSFLYDMLLAHRQKRYDMSSLRFFLCGGSPADPALAREALGFGMRVLNVYGATESVPHMGTPPRQKNGDIRQRPVNPFRRERDDRSGGRGRKTRVRRAFAPLSGTEACLPNSLKRFALQIIRSVAPRKRRIFPRNDRPYGLKCGAFQTENALKAQLPGTMPWSCENGAFDSPSDGRHDNSPVPGQAFLATLRRPQGRTFPGGGTFCVCCAGRLFPI